MPSPNDLPATDPMRECEILKAVAEELHRLADEATERYRAAVERVGGEPALLARMRKRQDDKGGR